MKNHFFRLCIVGVLYMIGTIIYSYFFGLPPFNFGITIGYPALYYQFYLAENDLQHGTIGGINIIYNFLIILVLYISLYNFFKKIKNTLILLITLGISSCNFDNKKHVYIDFDKNYYDLFKDVKLDSSRYLYPCFTNINNKKYFFESFILNKNIMQDNIIDINIGKNNNILVNMEVIEKVAYKHRLKEIFDTKIKGENKNLNLLVFYDDFTNFKQKSKVLVEVFEYINFKNDSISNKLFSKNYNELKQEELYKVQFLFYPKFVFSTKKPLNIPPPPPNLN